MTKEQFIHAAAKKTCYPETTVAYFVNAFTDIIRDEMKKGGKVSIRDFGTFEIKHRAPRVGRNPHTNEVINIPERNMPVWKPAEKLVSLIAGGKE